MSYPSSTIQNALTILWDQGYHIKTLTVDHWSVTPSQTTHLPILPHIQLDSAHLIDLAELHQTRQNIQIRSTLQHDSQAYRLHACATLRRLGWHVIPYGDHRWKLVSPQAEAPLLTVGADRLVQHAIACEDAHLVALYHRLQDVLSIPVHDMM